MTILSCDPGIRNLGLCIMNKDAEILFWDNLDIFNDEKKCVAVCKNGNTCGRICTLQLACHDDEPNVNYFCKIHFPKHVTVTRKHAMKKRTLVKKYLLQDIAMACISRLDSVMAQHLSLFESIDTIHIELQLKCARRNVFVSNILYGHLLSFYMQRARKPTIRFKMAREKFKWYHGPFMVCPLKSAYAKRKWLSVQYARWFLEQCASPAQREQWLPVFLGLKKQDDAADSLCQCLSALFGDDDDKNENKSDDNSENSTTTAKTKRKKKCKKTTSPIRRSRQPASPVAVAVVGRGGVQKKKGVKRVTKSKEPIKKPRTKA